jgi:hypothetical protein
VIFVANGRVVIFHFRNNREALLQILGKLPWCTGYVECCDEKYKESLEV